MAKLIQSYEIYEKIPSRDHFIDKKLHKKLTEDIAHKKEMLFLPNDVVEKNDWFGGVPVYRIYLFGIIPSGCKTCVVLDNIDIFTEVRVPDDTDSAIFLQKLSERAITAAIKFKSMKITIGYPYIGFCETPIKWIKVNFSDIIDRKKFIEWCHDTKNSFNKVLHTAYDDVGGKDYYFKAIARHYQFNTSSWNKLPAQCYREFQNSQSNCSITLLIDVDKFIPVADTEISSFNLDCLLKDKTMTMRWDIETHTYVDTGDAPRDTDDPDKYVIFMLAMTFHWHYTNEPLMAVCLVDANTNLSAISDMMFDKWSTSDFPVYVVVCNTEEELLKSFPEIWKKMSPDIISAFNGGDFDTPITRAKLTKYNHLSDFIEKVSSLKIYKKGNKIDDDKLKYYFANEKIKISAEENMDMMAWKIPGVIDTDTMITFKQLYPREEVGRKYSLNLYLKLNKLGSKDDMPYGRMKQIYELCRYIESLASCTCGHRMTKSPIKYSDRLPITSTNFNIFVKSYSDKWDAVETTCPCKLRDYFRSQMSFVVKYCLVDAFQLQQLETVRSVVSDKRELSNMSFVSLYDSYFRANGMKVRNLIAAIGKHAGIKMSNYKVINTKKKYPGAWVFPPIKGLENNRPVVGLDFSSLYPSLMMCYNLSADKFVDTAERAAELVNKGYLLHKISFTLEDGEHIEGWTVRHKGIHITTCGCPLCLNDQTECVNHLSKYKTILDYEKYADNTFKRKDGKLIPIHGQGTPLPGETMGLSSYVLKNLFDRRAAIKKILIALTDIKEKFSVGLEIDDKLLQIADIKREDITIKELAFRIAKVDSKQKAMKVHMNTFYGESGNYLSPLYVLAIAGGVTAAGQYNIKWVESYLKQNGYKVHYGDTDSVYISCPPHIFTEITNKYNEDISKNPDKKYEIKEEYWKTLVRMTRTDINSLKLKVNDYLTDDNKTEFLKMAYEEVLFPVMFTGKKKYFGIPHMETENFTINTIKDVFIRGIDIIKQGQSKLAKTIGFEVIRQILAVDNEKSVMEICLNKINEIYKKDWDISYFEASAKYKPLKNNVRIHTFKNRMENMRNLYTLSGDLKMAALYTVPEPGDPFKYIMVKQTEYFDKFGKKILEKKGDVMEYLHVYSYHKEHNIPMEIDLNYYIDSSIISLLARFISSEDMFAPSEPMEYDKLDKTTCDNAIKYLKHYRDDLIGYNPEKMRQVGHEYKRLYKIANNKRHLGVCSKVGGASILLNDIDLYFENENTDGSTFIMKKIEEYVISQCNDDYSHELVTSLRKKYDMAVINNLLGTGNPMVLKIHRKGLMTKRMSSLESKYNTEKNNILEHLRKISDIIYKYRLTVDNIITQCRQHIMNDNYNDTVDNLLNNMANISDDDADILNMFYDKLLILIAIRKTFYQSFKIKEYVRNQVDILSGVCDSSLNNNRLIQNRSILQDYEFK
jgi:DNA polymerase elongation subunit (family B)